MKIFIFVNKCIHICSDWEMVMNKDGQEGGGDGEEKEQVDIDV
jgi:hypothetical protein